MNSSMENKETAVDIMKRIYDLIEAHRLKFPDFFRDDVFWKDDYILEIGVAVLVELKKSGWIEVRNLRRSHIPLNYLCGIEVLCSYADPNIIDLRRRDQHDDSYDHARFLADLSKPKLVGNITDGYCYAGADFAATKDTDISKEISMLKKKTINGIFGLANLKEEDKNMREEIYVNGRRQVLSDMFISENYGTISEKSDRPQDLIKNVIFSKPCTIVIWKDGTKTIVRCSDELFDKEKGLAMAIVKKFFGTNHSKSNYNDVFKKWIKDDEPEHYSTVKKFYTTRMLAEKEGVTISRILNRIHSGMYPGAFKENGVWLIPIDTDKED